MDITNVMINQYRNFITFRLTFNNETRRIRFRRRNCWFHHDTGNTYYYESDVSVWVSIPELPDIRTGWSSYTNKLRPARLYVKVIGNKYILVDRYEVLRKFAHIYSWKNTKRGKRFTDSDVARDHAYCKPVGTWDEPYEYISVFI